MKNFIIEVIIEAWIIISFLIQNEVAQGNYTSRVVSKSKDKLIFNDLVLVGLEKTRSRIISFSHLLQDQITLNILSLVDVFDCLDETLIAIGGDFFS